MSSSPAVPALGQRSSFFPTVVYMNGGDRREIQLSLMGLSIGRRPGKDIEIADPRVSRDHAEIICEEGNYFLVDNGSKLGTYVNGERVQRKKLGRNDRIEISQGVGAVLLFDPAEEKSIVAREFLSQISNMGVQQQHNDLEKLTFFLEAARKLNSAGALDEILISLIETTLKLTGAERGFIFLRERDASLVLAAAVTSKGERITSDKTISHSILQEAAKSASEFVITDTMKAKKMSESIIAHDLRSVIAIPLKAHGVATKEDVLGVLYLDSRFVGGSISGVSQDLLGVIAREAAAVVESTHLAAAEEAGKRYQQELSIAAQIQQRLMTVRIPELNFATLNAKNVPCKDIGGDFFDVVTNEDGLTVVITDVSGKGISAAILASILQGLIYSQVVARVPLAEIASSANRFLCQRVQGEKYATVVIVRVAPHGEMEVVNCGHVPPLLVASGKSERLKHGGLPIGLIAETDYSSHKVQLRPGDRVVLVTDGVTEAENKEGDMFGEDRLEEAAIGGEESCFELVFNAVKKFCGDTPLNDDCTLLELIYRGRPGYKTEPTMSIPAQS